MKEKDSSKSILTGAENRAQEAKSKYYNFFEDAPVALYIEDFSEVKLFVEKKAKEANLSIEIFLRQNPRVLENLHEKVVIKDVNTTAVKLYKAKSKNDLIDNLERVFTVDSAIGFSKLVIGILTGKKETTVESVNKTFDNEVINVIIKYNVEVGSEDTLKNVIVSIQDITERVKINNALAISERRYKESQEIAKIASWFFDFKTKQLYWSDEVYSFLELKREDANLGLDFYLSFIHEKDREMFSDISIENLLKNPKQDLNYRVVTKNGDVRHVYEKRSVVIENDRIERIIGTCQDVTDRVLSEKKLSATKKLLSNTLSSIQDGFVILDSNSNYLFVNKLATDLLGRSEEELIGENIWTKFPEKEGDVFYDNYQKAVETKKPISFENYFSPWGRWFKNRIIPSNDTVLIFFHETTDKKETENKIKEAYNIINKSSSVAILCDNDIDFPVVFASENAEKLFGYTSDELLSHKIKIHELVYPDDLEDLRATFFTIIKGQIKDNINPLSFRIVTKDNIVKWIEASIDVIVNDENEVTQVQGIVEDITARKKTEDLFFKSNQRLQDQFNNTPLASIIWDLDFKVIDWNNSAHRIFGYSAEEAKGKHAKDLIVPKEIVQDIDTLWQNLLKQKSGYRNKNKNVTKYGETIICDWYNVTLKDVDGNVIGVASLVDNITERTNSKLLLQKSEKKYRDIFDKSIDPVLIIKNGVFVDCNKATLTVFGYENKVSLLQIHPSQLSPATQPNGSNSYEKAEEMMRIAVAEGSNRFRWNHQKRNGQIFPAEVTLTRIIDDDDKSSIHAVVRDITERVKKEEVEKIVYNISNAALTIEDFKEFGYFIREELHKIIDTNNFYIALYNEESNSFHTPVVVDEQDDTSEFSVEKSLTGYVLKSNESILFTNETHTKLIESGEVDLIGIDSKIWLGVPLKSQDKVFGVIVVQSYTNKYAYSEDDVQLLEFVAGQISSAILRKDGENELKKALLKAQESDRLKSAFLANMSHEIRTPMNGIIGFSELFLEKDLSYSERKEYAKIVINSSKQLLTIVNDILDISKIEAGVVKLNYEHVNLNKLLDEIEAFYEPNSQNNNLKLISEKGLNDSDCNIDVDRTKLSQIITNLLSNAFKFTNEGTVIFGYELLGETLQFWVRDTGVGIDERFQDKIFDRFIQAEEDFEKQNKGTGLGLAISKKFVELFKGEIWLDSTKNGTVVYFTIPYTKVAAIKSNVGADKKISKKIGNNEVTILVAEDEEYNLLYINELFSKTNYKIIEAINGKEALNISGTNSTIDLVLMDIKMPIMNGHDAMKEIKKIRPELPIIALSAFAMESDKENALATGFDSYLSKPIDKKLLFQLIEEFTK